jgi:hypothetical protein
MVRATGGFEEHGPLNELMECRKIMALNRSLPIIIVFSDLGDRTVKASIPDRPVACTSALASKM